MPLLTPFHPDLSLQLPKFYVLESSFVTLPRMAFDHPSRVNEGPNDLFESRREVENRNVFNQCWISLAFSPSLSIYRHTSFVVPWAQILSPSSDPTMGSITKHTPVLGEHVSGQSNKPLSSPPHSLTSQKVLEELKSDATRGLDPGDVPRRLAEFGSNDLDQKKGVQPFKIFIEQIFNAMTLVSSLAWIKQA
jgi:magnesium-transporting ATPase (P-type)